VHQVGFSLHNYMEMHGQQNIKYMKIVVISDTLLTFILLHHNWISHLKIHTAR